MVNEQFKQTDVGIIPEDWDSVSLSDVFEIIDAGVSVNSDRRKRKGHCFICTGSGT